MAEFWPTDSLFLGFDSSTQSLKVTILDHKLNIVKSLYIHFDSDLPHYGTKDGVIRDTRDNGRIVSPTLMWVEALDLALERLKESNIEFAKIVAISGSGQQHGSVYWNKNALDILESLDDRKRLVDQVGNALSLKESPIWMDCSTSFQCKEIENFVGGALELAIITGSRAYERFTGPQIRKIFQNQPQIYNDTHRISLVSSFMASVFIGKYADIDHTDGAGMNLLDIKQRTWSKTALAATAPNLAEKLGTLSAAHKVAGLISPYFVRRFGFIETCTVINWSGDNPNSLAGLGLSKTGDLAISLGTSDTVFGISDNPKPGLEGHVFPNPVNPESYMVMLCYKNGSLIREDVRDRCAGKSWETFNELLQQTPPLNDGKMGFFYKDHEILPPLPIGFHRYVIRNMAEGKEEKVDDFDAATEVRAVVEGQFVSMRGHAERFGLPSSPERLMVTGGASANPSILNVLAGVLGCDVQTVERPDSASLGAALRAAHGWLCEKRGIIVPIHNLYDLSFRSCKVSAKAGSPTLVASYSKMMRRRLQIENRLLQNLSQS